MPFDTCPDLLVDESPASRRVSQALSTLAMVGIFGSLLIASPNAFSPEHRADHSPLRWLVDALSLYGQWPTLDGKEIRFTIFNLCAALMLLVAGLRLLTQRAQPRMALDDLLDYRARAASPATWGLFFLFCSVLSSSFADSRRLALGQSALHGFQAAWVLPLALLLEPRHARHVVKYMMWILSATAIIGLWYYFARVYPRFGLQARLKYPMSTELSMAACLLPMPFLAIATLAARSTEIGALKHRIAGWIGPLALLVPVMIAFALCRSRSGMVGALAGAVTMLCLYCKGRWRHGILIATVVVIVGAGAWVAQERVKTDSMLRSHSLRARVDFAWPYAIALWRAKPILGHGDGAYGWLAGQFARVDQIDDPNVMSFGNEQIWLSHADSEPLQLLSDIGIVGLSAAIAALATTLVVAMRFCDAARGQPQLAGQRHLVLGLTAALIAMAAGECTSNGLRLTGLPPVFLTTAAVLWTLVRRHRPPREVATPDRWMPAGVLQMAGLGLTGVGLALVVAACVDAGAARSCFRASSALVAGHNEEAVIEADRAARGSLSADQQLKARLFAIWAMSQEFDNRLQSSDPPDTADFTIASAALGRLSALDVNAPRFLRTAALRAELYANLTRAAERRNDAAAAADFAQKRNDALARLIADEPFRMPPVQALLQAEPRIPTLERLTQLRRLIRAGEMPPGFVNLFVSQAQVPEFVAALGDLTNVALNDVSRDPAAWQDRLSPETLRLAALFLELQGKPAEAANYASKAVEMYDHAGARLFAADAAARHERIRLEFQSDPTADNSARLTRLAAAAQLAEVAIGPAGQLPEPMGSTRLDLMLAAGFEAEAEAQARYLNPSAEPATLIAQGYLTLASTAASADPERARKWAARAAELNPKSLDAHALLLDLLLKAGDEDSVARHLKKLTTILDPADLSNLRSGLRDKHPQSRVWNGPGRP